VSPDSKRSVVSGVALVMRAVRAAAYIAGDRDARRAAATHVLIAPLFGFRILRRATTDDAAWLGGLLIATYSSSPSPLCISSRRQRAEPARGVLVGQRAEADDRFAAGWGGLAGAALGLAGHQCPLYVCRSVS
jgi:hypothetical protein